MTYNLPLPTTFSANDDSDQSDVDSVENRTSYTQVPLMSTGGRPRVLTIATRDLMDVSSESEAESNETKKMELKRAETLAAAKDHKKQVQLRKKHPLRQSVHSDGTDSEIEITDEALIEKDKDPTLTENRRTQPSRSAKTNPIDRFGAVVDVSKCDKSWREAINMVANMSRKEIEAKADEVASAEQEEVLWWFRNHVFTPVRRCDLPHDANVVPHKWVISQKDLPDQMGQQVKCRLVAVGSQDQRVNMRRYSPTIGKETIKIALQICASKGF